MVTGHALWLFIYLTNHIGIAQLMETLCHSQFFWHQISSMRWQWHWQNNSTLLCTSHTISIGSACLFPWAFMLEMTQFPTSITLDLRPIFPLTMLWLEPIIPICLLSRLSLSKAQFHWHQPLSQLLLTPRLLMTS